jgi:uncharacterized protein (TIGR01370 family)
MRAWMWMLALVVSGAALEAATAQVGAPAAGGSVATVERPAEGAADPAAVAANGAVEPGVDAPAENPPPEPPGIACSDMADRSRARRLNRALKAGFGVQYWGEGFSAEGLAAQPHGLLIIEATKVGTVYSQTGREELFTDAEIESISRAGLRPVLAYLNVGEIENYRDFWAKYVEVRAPGDVLPAWFGPRAGHGDHLAGYWMPEWHDLIVARVDRLMSKGFGGIFLDDVLHYYSHAADENLVWPGGTRPGTPTEAPELAREMMQLVVTVADRVRQWDCNALIIVNNAVFIGRDAAEAASGDGTTPVFDRYRAAIDAILVENVLEPGAHMGTRTALTEDFLDSGITVMTVDALSLFHEGDRGALRERLAEEADAAGFVPYFVENSGFNRLWAPVLMHPKS